MSETSGRSCQWEGCDSRATRHAVHPYTTHLDEGPGAAVIPRPGHKDLCGRHAFIKFAGEPAIPKFCTKENDLTPVSC